MATPLTQRQQSVLDAIKRYVSREGFAPSYREIAQECGLKSHTEVGEYLKALERAGKVKLRAGHSQRAIALVKRR